MSDSVPPVKLVIGFPKICNPILDLYKSAIKNITNSRNTVTIMVLTIKVNLANPLPLYFSGFF